MEGWSLRILDLGTIRPGRYTSAEGTSVDLRAGLDIMEKRCLLPLPDIEPGTETIVYSQGTCSSNAECKLSDFLSCN
jgi:hypothetical protein